MSEGGVVQPSLEGTIDTWPEAPEGGWDRVLLKLSGEAFAGEGDLGVDPDVVQSIARQIAGIVRAGTEVAVVIGGVADGFALLDLDEARALREAGLEALDQLGKDVSFHGVVLASSVRNET